MPAELFVTMQQQLGIGPGDPWVWITTKGPLSPEHATFSIDDGGPTRSVLPSPIDPEQWRGYSVDLIGFRLEEGDTYRGLLVQWWQDLTLDARFVRVRWHRRVTYEEENYAIDRPSLLYVEYVVPVFGVPDAAIRGLHHRHPDRMRPADQREEVDRANFGLNLLFKLQDSRGKHQGDGATWAGGTPDFLDDLWTTLETLTRECGTPFGHDPMSRQFRSKMREWASEWTVRDWLNKGGLRPTDIKSGRVTRANYSQFVPT